MKAVIGTSSEAGVWFIVQELKRRQFVTVDDSGKRVAEEPDFKLTLTFDGWDRFDRLKREAQESRRLFMAMKFGDGQLDGMYRDHFKRAIGATGFTLERIDERPRAGLIDDRLRLQIRACRMLIADLTHHNNGAYWEAGFAEGLGKPVIYTCRRDVFEDRTQGTHFDTNHHLTVPWDTEDPEDAVQRLKATVRETLPLDAKMEDGS